MKGAHVFLILLLDIFAIYNTTFELAPRTRSALRKREYQHQDSLVTNTHTHNTWLLLNTFSRTDEIHPCICYILSG
jgi:hypothetical protein